MKTISATQATSARLANLTSTEYEFADSCVIIATTGMYLVFHLPFWRKCRVTVCHSNELHRAMRQAVWALLETNMHDLWPFCSLPVKTLLHVAQLSKLISWLGSQGQAKRALPFKVTIYFSSLERFRNSSSSIFYVSFWGRGRRGRALLVNIYQKYLPERLT